MSNISYPQLQLSDQLKVTPRWEVSQGSGLKMINMGKKQVGVGGAVAEPTLWHKDPLLLVPSQA